MYLQYNYALSSQVTCLSDCHNQLETQSIAIDAHHRYGPIDHIGNIICSLKYVKFTNDCKYTEIISDPCKCNDFANTHEKLFVVRDMLKQDAGQNVHIIYSEIARKTYPLVSSCRRQRIKSVEPLLIP